MTRIIITPMRLVAALLAAFCMAAGAQAAGKGGLVTLTLTGEPLPQALKLIEQRARQRGAFVQLPHWRT